MSKRIASTILIFIGIVATLFAAVSLYEQYSVKKFTELEVGTSTDSSTQSGVADIVGVQLAPGKQPIPVSVAEKKGDQWLASKKAISLIAPTASNSGAVLYGHNWPSLFKPLHSLETGDVITVFFKDGARANYIVDEKEVISPKKDSLLPEVDTKHLLLYTCTGFLDQQRLLVFATQHVE